MKLYSEVVRRESLADPQIRTMYGLMDTFYDHMEPDAFLKDLADKDYCILLLDGGGQIVGFSTQKTTSVAVGGDEVFGVFSGDTIIHKDFWGSRELFTAFASHYLAYGEKYEEYYWFLIVKGYKTYKILSTFFLEFYPRAGAPVPTREAAIMAAYGQAFFPGDYNAQTGVVEYRRIKDVLKIGVADVDERVRRDQNTRFFERANPGYLHGNDLVCIAKLSKENIRPAAHRLLFGR